MAIRNPRAADGGSAFQPGEEYYDGNHPYAHGYSRIDISREVREGKYEKKIAAEPTEEEKMTLKPGGDGKRRAFANGIFSTREAAVNHALRMTQASEGPPVYLVHFPRADNALSEPMIAG
ncbi:MAG: hypothetical protein LBD06_09560 [Candidatus Accumulibacter sp.]|nr:hypothetical protein [Accumulibacter sp.]